MMTLRALVRLSFLEFLREKVVWVAVFIAILLFAVSFFLGSLSFNEQQRILAHIGWSTIQLSTLGMGLFMAANWLHREMDRQTCLIVLARPVTRDQFLVAKFLPIGLLIALVQLILALLLFFLLKSSFSIDNFLIVLLGTFTEVLVVLSITFFLATLTRPAIAFIAGISSLLIGNWSQEIEFFGEKTNNIVYISVAKIGKNIFPNLFQFNWRSVYFLKNGVSSDQVLWVLVHSAGWILLMICLSIFVFRRKDLV